MCYQDLDPTKPNSRKIFEACEKYERTRGRKPDLVILNDKARIHTGALEGMVVGVRKDVRPNTFLIGYMDDEVSGWFQRLDVDSAADRSPLEPSTSRSTGVTTGA